MSKLLNTLSALPLCGLDDENFQLTLFENSNGSVNFDPERLASLKFNSFLSTTYKNFSLCKDLDPDHNFYRESDDCKYYTEGSFNNALAQGKSCLNQNNNSCNLPLLHINIRSISKKIDKLSTLLGSISLQFSVIAVTETWLEDSSHSSDIPGFNFVHKHRENRTGVASVFILLITSSLNTALTWHFLPIVRSLCLSKSIEQNKKTVVEVVYRPPDRNLNDFNNELDHLISIISKENKTVFPLGDWNMNLMNHLHHQAMSDFLELLFSRMFFPMITRPT